VSKKEESDAVLLSRLKRELAKPRLAQSVRNDPNREGVRMTYDSKVRTNTQAIAEKVLITMSHNRMGEILKITDAPNLRDKERLWIPWTPETLVIALQLWDSTISLSKVNEILEVLVTSRLIIRRDALLTHHELTSSGRAETVRLGKSC
jgi:hypothetical protein